jgi:hypothetical protein
MRPRSVNLGSKASTLRLFFLRGLANRFSLSLRGPQGAEAIPDKVASCWRSTCYLVERGVVLKVPEGYNRPDSMIERRIRQRMAAVEPLFAASHIGRLLVGLGGWGKSGRKCRFRIFVIGSVFVVRGDDGMRKLTYTWKSHINLSLVGRQQAES